MGEGASVAIIAMMPSLRFTLALLPLAVLCAESFVSLADEGFCVADEKNAWTPGMLDRKLAQQARCQCPTNPPCMPSSNDSQCYCSSSSTGTLIDCCCKYDLRIDWDFWYRYPILYGEDANWHFYERDGYIANGGKMVFTKSGGLMNAARFNTTVPQNSDLYADNYKYLIFANEPMELNMNADTVFQYVLKDAQTYLARADQTPFPVQIINCPGQDFRVATTVVMLNDPEGGFQFGYLITSDMVYAIYARLPDNRDIIGNYAAFTFVVPVGYRLPNDEHKLKLVVSKRMQAIRWQIGTRDVFRVMNVGRYVDRQYMTLDLGGGEQDEIFPDRLYYGLGAMDFLNHYPACYKLCSDKPCCYPPARMALVKTGNATALPQYDPIEGKPVPATFWDVGGRAQYRDWGQGAAATFRRLTIWEQDCKYRYVHKDAQGKLKKPARNQFRDKIPAVFRFMQDKS